MDKFIKQSLWFPATKKNEKEKYLLKQRIYSSFLSHLQRRSIEKRWICLLQDWFFRRCRKWGKGKMRTRSFKENDCDSYYVGRTFSLLWVCGRTLRRCVDCCVHPELSIVGSSPANKALDPSGVDKLEADLFGNGWPLQVDVKIKYKQCMHESRRRKMRGAFQKASIDAVLYYLFFFRKFHEQFFQ